MAGSELETEPSGKGRGRHLVVGSAGLHYVCWRLARLGWNVVPTARNARGVDVVLYSQDARRRPTVQVKALSKPAPAPLGGDPENLLADLYVICVRAMSDSPTCYILDREEVRAGRHEGRKGPARSYWLQERAYRDHEGRWDKIGSGDE